MTAVAPVYDNVAEWVRVGAKAAVIPSGRSVSYSESTIVHVTKTQVVATNRSGQRIRYRIKSPDRLTRRLGDYASETLVNPLSEEAQRQRQAARVAVCRMHISEYHDIVRKSLEGYHSDPGKAYDAGIGIAGELVKLGILKSFEMGDRPDA